MKIITLTPLASLRVYRHERPIRGRDPLRHLRLFLRRRRLRLADRWS